MMKLDRTAAHDVLENVVVQANTLGRPVCVAVTDERGALLAFTRMDGAPIRSIKLSEAKAISGLAPAEDQQLADTAAAAHMTRQD